MNINADVDTPTCADCGASNPGWASLNHCVLICSECCFIHRNLGRHISQIRSLTAGIWHTNQLKLVNYLYKNGSNNIWEHSLIDSNSGKANKKKPVSNDPIIPKKETFITDKYVRLIYAIRPAKDEFTVDDLNRQLWSSVRTGHVITALRLLALGASPDFVDQGNTPLHIAAKNGQELQVELLWIYGANFSSKNFNGKTPSELAKKEGHLELSERIIELSFEISDHFSLFLCGRKPSHKDNQHFLIPDLVDPFISERMHNIGKQIHLISDLLFERLVQDVYDEVDRREIDLQWSSLNNSQIRMHKHVAIFLPPNPQLSATRNQMRQKLAKFSSSDFFYLVIDLLKEIRRRYFGIQLPVEDINLQKSNEICFLSDEQLDGNYTRGKLCLSASSNEANRSQHHLEEHPSSLDNYLELKEKLRDTNERVEQLVMSNTDILGTLKKIQKSIERLEYDQASIQHEMNEKVLKNYFYRSFSPTQVNNPNKTPPLQNSSLSVSLNNATAQIGAVMMSASTLMRPPSNQQKYVANYSTDTYPSAKMISNNNNNRHPSSSSITNNSSLINSIIPPHSSISMKINNQQNNNKGIEERHNSFTGCGTTTNNKNIFSNEKKHSLESNIVNSTSISNSNEVKSYRKNSSHSISHLKIVRDVEHSLIPSSSGGEIYEHSNKPQGTDVHMNKIFNGEVFPDNLILETELLTNAIKSLLADLQPDSNINRETNAMYHADSINHHIIRILSVIPDSYIRIEAIQKCAFLMEAAMKQLSKKCISRPLNIDESCQAAYDVAKAAKELLVIVHKHAENTTET